MKLVKILLGLLFGACAVVSLVEGLGKLKAPLSSTGGLGGLGVVVAAFGTWALFSAWSFQSAFPKRTTPEDGIETADATNSQQPQGPATPDQPDG